MTRSVRLALAEWQVEAVADIDDYTARSTQRVEMATAAGAEILCFAEYGMFELASLSPGLAPMEQVVAVQRWLPDCRDLFTSLAVAHGVTIVAPGFIEATDRGPVKRAWVCGPEGSVSIQDKIHLTAWEKRAGLVNGEAIGVFRHDGIPFGVAVCHDAEFPTQVRALVDAGIELLLVPSATETPAGFERVRLACRARALEGQIPVAQAPLTGFADFSELVEENHGHAGVYVTPDRGLPADGVVATGTGAGWLIADVDLVAIADARHRGDVTVRHDWDTPLRRG